MLSDERIWGAAIDGFTRITAEPRRRFLLRLHRPSLHCVGPPGPVFIRFLLVPRVGAPHASASSAGRPNDTETAVHGVQLGHQAADQGPDADLGIGDVRTGLDLSDFVVALTIRSLDAHLPDGVCVPGRGAPAGMTGTVVRHRWKLLSLGVAPNADVDGAEGR